MKRRKRANPELKGTRKAATEVQICSLLFKGVAGGWLLTMHFCLALSAERVNRDSEWVGEQTRLHQDALNFLEHSWRLSTLNALWVLGLRHFSRHIHAIYGGQRWKHKTLLYLRAWGRQIDRDRERGKDRVQFWLPYTVGFVCKVINSYPECTFDVGLSNFFLALSRWLWRAKSEA